MSLGAILEPLVVVSLLAGGALVNRNTSYNLATGASPVWQQTGRRSSSSRRRVDNPASPRDLETGKSPAEGDVLGLGAWTWSSNSSTSSLTDLTDDDQDPTTRLRTLRFFGWKRTVRTPNTEVFRDRLLSRVLRRFPFLVETWYWALIYWVRASSFLTSPSLAMRMLTTKLAGLSARSCIYRPYPRRRDRRCRQKTCSPSHPPRAAPPHISRTARASVVPETPVHYAMDEQNLLLHPYPWNDPLPHHPLLSHHNPAHPQAATGTI